MSFTIKLRRDTIHNWDRANPVLNEGEPGYEDDTGKFKIGNGVARWSDLAYFAPGDWLPEAIGVTQAELLEHINSLTPHPVYDDGPSLILLYQNAKV